MKLCSKTRDFGFDPFENTPLGKSAGQLAYEADCAARPLYDDGGKRRSWDQLGKPEQDTWHRNPTPNHR